jgi:hypothetical protein
MHTVAGLVQARFDWSHALHELGRVLPSAAALNSLQGAVGSGGSVGSSTPASSSTPAAGATAASSTPAGSTPAFTLTGCATSQSEVAQTLQRLRLIDGVEEVQLQSSTKSGASGASASSGTCAGNDPVFSVQMVFTALPAAAVGGSASSTSEQVSATSGVSR